MKSHLHFSLFAGAFGWLAGVLLFSSPALGQRTDSSLHSREVSEHVHAHRRHESGDLRPFRELLSRAQAVGKGEYLGVEPNLGNSVYRFKFMRPDANVVWIDVDGRTGRVLSERH